MISTKMMEYLEGKHRITCPQDIIMIKHQIDMAEDLGMLEHTSDWDYGITIIKHDGSKIGYQWIDDEPLYADSFKIDIHKPEMDKVTVTINVTDNDGNLETFTVMSDEIMFIAIEDYT